MPIESGHTYVFDKGYAINNWWQPDPLPGPLTSFTRFKSNAGIEIQAEREIKRGKIARKTWAISSLASKNKRPGGKRINHYHGTIYYCRGTVQSMRAEGTLGASDQRPGKRPVLHSSAIATKRAGELNCSSSG